MSLEKNIFELRKKRGLSQEQLGEKINVTRQTISNWELGETSPNPEQLRLLSKTLGISVDELLDNDISNFLVEKVSNTEKLAGLVLKFLKVLGIIFLVILVIDIVSLILFICVKDSKGGIDSKTTQEVMLQCFLDEKDYVITVNSDSYFNCLNCPKEMRNELKDNYIDFSDIEKSENEVIDYFESNNGFCE